MCGICPAGCGVEVHLLDGRIERLKPLKNHPLGIVCPRGARAREIVYSKDRILHPQRRIGRRGENRFEQIGWDEAYEVIVGGLRRVAAEYGPQAACIYSGRGNFEFGLNEMFAPADTTESSANAVLFPFGSPNATGVWALCYAAHAILVTHACFGEQARNLAADIDAADLIVVWGANPATDSPPINLRRIKKRRAAGAEVVVIDPRRSETARSTDAQWLGVRPGTDGALALGMIHVLIAEDRYDHAFVRNWSHGFEALRTYARDFSPERVARITGVDACRIRALARAIASTPRCCVVMYTGLEYADGGVQAIRAVWSLQALAGNLDAPGGNVFKMPDRPRLNRLPTPQPTDGVSPIGAAEHPLYCKIRHEAHAAELPKAILENDPYPLRAMIIGGSSVITAWPDPSRWRQALAALDLLVVIDRFPTADSVYADIVLPAATMFETESYMAYDGGRVQLRRRVIEPLGESRGDYLIFAELARRLGYGGHWPQTEESMVEFALQGSGVSRADLLEHPEGVDLAQPKMRYRKYALGELRADRRPGFATPTGRFEFASVWLRRRGYDALPVYVEPSEGPLRADPALVARFPLVLSTGARTQYAFRSQHYNIPGLVSLQPSPQIRINPVDAAARGIADGDEVEAVSPRGRIALRALVTGDIAVGCVEANMGGGGVIGLEAWRRCNVNELTDAENRDPISGFPVFKALLCDVRPIRGRMATASQP